MIPVNEPLLNGNEAKYLSECIETGWISSEGPFVQKFEQQFSRRINKEHGIAVCNGTAALELAVAALDIGPGDEVIMPAFTIVSCANAVIRAGATPVLVDCEPDTWNMAADKIEQCITNRTRAIMMVHIYGLPSDVETIKSIADKHGLLLIEDAAEALGQTYNNQPCGSFGDISIFSFYPNKLVTTGEGGMVLTNDRKLADKSRSLMNLCFGSENRFQHEHMGWNFRMSNLQAAVGLAQLEKLDESVGLKRRIGERYNKLLENIPGLQLPVTANQHAENLYWVYGLVLQEELSLDNRQVMLKLGERGIGSRPFFWPMHKQPVFIDRGLFKQDKHPNAERIAIRGFYLPSGLSLTKEQQENIVTGLTGVLS